MKGGEKELKRKLVSGILQLLIFVGMLVLAAKIPQVRSLEPPPIEWSRTYGYPETGSRGYSVVQTSDGGYAIGAIIIPFPGPGEWDIWLIKTDANGNIEWDETYGGANTDYVYSVIQTSDGGYALAGSTGTEISGLLVKTDSAGNMEWSQTYEGSARGGERVVVQTSDGGYALAGGIYGSGGSDFWLLKTDSAGNVEWSQTYEGSEWDEGTSVVQTADGGYAIAGYTYSFGEGNYDFWLVKTDSAGNVEWSQTYGGASRDCANSVVQTADGGYALAGYTYSLGDPNGDLWLVKTDSIGNMEWNQPYGGTDWDLAESVVQTSDGGYIITGGLGGEESDFCWVKIDSGGNVEWSQTYGLPYPLYDWAYSVVQTSDGGFATVGISDGATLVKIAAEQPTATVDINPDKLNLKSKAKWITCYIGLPEGYNVADIDATTILLERTIPAVTDTKYTFVTDPSQYLVDHDGDTIMERMVKFDAVDVRSYLSGKSGLITLTVTGELFDGTPFEGCDTIES